MNSSRRNFLRHAAWLAAALPVGAAGLRAGSAGTNEPQRRGLLFDADDLPRIRANIANPRFAECWETLTAPDLEEDSAFLEHQVRFDHHADDMLRVRGILERTSFVYAVTGDRRQLAVARAAARKLIAYPKWDMFLEGGKQVLGIQRASEAVIALAFALDWLGEAWTPAERAEIETAIGEKGAPACAATLTGMMHPDRVVGWTMDPEDAYPAKVVDLKHWPVILNSTNLKVIPTAALGIAACLLQSRHPEAERWLGLARASAHAFATNYGADGSFGEGVSYWGYTTLHLALFAEVLWRTRGIDERSLINFPGTIRYALAMTMPRRGEPTTRPEKKQGYVGVQGVPNEEIPPRYDIVNFGDANVAVEISAAAWVARTHQDPLSQQVARDIGEANSHYGIIWYQPEGQVAAPEPRLQDDHMANDRVVSRSGWMADDSVVALRSGRPANHEHADRNSVIFKAHGERLLNDPLRAAYAWNQPRWKLRLTSAHTAVLIGGRGHQYHDGHEGTNASLATARITAFRTGPGWMTVTSDATAAYRLVIPDVRLVERTLVFLKPDVLLLVDRVELKSAPLPVQARFQVFNDDRKGSCAASEAGFQIRRPFATLQAVVAGTSAIQVTPGQIDLPASAGVFPFVEVATAPGMKHAILTACTAAPAGQGHGSIVWSTENGEWQARGEHRGRRVEVGIRVEGERGTVVTVGS